MASSTVCTSCQSRKKKCDRSLPSCGFCLKNRLVCEYVRHHRKRGLRAGYVSELEKRLEAVEQDIRFLKAERTHLSEATVHPVPSIQDSLPDLGDSGGRENFDLQPSGTATLNPGSATGFTEFVPDISVNEPSQDPFAPALLSELCNSWFSKYHNWFPILHSPTLYDALQDPESLKAGPLFILCKSIMAITVAGQQCRVHVPERHRTALSLRLRQKIVIEALSHISIHSLQALLIVAILYHGEGKIIEFWNIVAFCKSISTQLGLRDLVATTPTVRSHQPPRMLSDPSILATRESLIRAYWGTEILDSSSTIGAAWNLSVSRPASTSSFPCSDDLFALPETLLQLFSFGEVSAPSNFHHYITLHHELFKVHALLQEPCDLASEDDLNRYARQCQAIQHDLDSWRERCEVTRPNPRTSIPCYVASIDGTKVFEPTIVLINATLNTASIVLWTRLAMPKTKHHDREERALEACLHACSDMANFVEKVDHDDMVGMSPQLIPCLFVGTRFLLVNARMSQSSAPSEAGTLLKSLQSCALQWPYAARLQIVLQTAIREFDLPSRRLSLPKEFYDLQYSAVDIDEAIRLWALELR